jgi:hypothetical protein
MNQRQSKSGAQGWHHRTVEFGVKDEEYRYRVMRTWEAAKPYVLFVLMNPSTATPEKDDSTIRRSPSAAGF